MCVCVYVCVSGIAPINCMSYIVNGQQSGQRPEAKSSHEWQSRDQSSQKTSNTVLKTRIKPFITGVITHLPTDFDSLLPEKSINNSIFDNYVNVLHISEAFVLSNSILILNYANIFRDLFYIVVNIAMFQQMIYGLDIISRFFGFNIYAFYQKNMKKLIVNPIYTFQLSFCCSLSKSKAKWVSIYATFLGLI